MAEYLVVYSDELYHYGVLGMKWGVRRYQNSDGSLTDKGRKRYQKKVSNREKRIFEREDLIKKQTSYIETGKKSLKDVEENGLDSNTFKKAYGDRAQYPDSAFEDLFGMSKSDALEFLKSDIKNEIVDSEKSLKILKKTVEDIHNTPINKLTYDEEKNRIQNNGRAMLAAGIGLSLGLSILGATKGIDAGLMGYAAAAGMGLTIIGTGKYETSALNRSYKKHIGV